MRNIYTMGFTKKSARQFFELIRAHEIDLLIDIRLNNKSQLAGFTKGEDLAYFLEEICHCGYEHCLAFAPTKELMDSYQNNKIKQPEFEETYNRLLEDRRDYKDFLNRYGAYENVCLLCSEATPERCHRRLLAEALVKEFPQLRVEHL